MSQLFTNLISNALKFSKPSSPNSVDIKYQLLSGKEVEGRPVRSAKSYHQLEVSDEGIGFNQEHSSQIFDIFQRLHTKTEYEGTGIGLATCKKIVENHGGCIYATSAAGEGATFTVLLPAE